MCGKCVFVKELMDKLEGLGAEQTLMFLALMVSEESISFRQVSLRIRESLDKAQQIQPDVAEAILQLDKISILGQSISTLAEDGKEKIRALSPEVKNIDHRNERPGTYTADKVKSELLLPESAVVREQAEAWLISVPEGQRTPRVRELLIASAWLCRKLFDAGAPISQSQSIATAMGKDSRQGNPYEVAAKHWNIFIQDLN